MRRGGGKAARPAQGRAERKRAPQRSAAAAWPLLRPLKIQVPVFSFLKFILFMRFFLLSLCCAFLLSGLQAQPWQPAKKDKKRTALLLGSWDTEGVEKSGRQIDVKKVFGEVIFHYYILERKNKKTNKMEKHYKYKVEMGGTDRIFDFELRGDSISFPDVDGWNDCHILLLDKKNMELEQVIDGNIHIWKLNRLPPAPKPKKETKKKKD